MKPSTRLLLRDDDGTREITWADFLAANPESETGWHDEIIEALETDGRYEGGGGAMPEWALFVPLVRS